ncbi:MAG: hypothetical protein JWO95_1269 [Verrucomicrobiales bacterium]|nr:hypothetical protein [Verrucomicrobiales bacterium]
MDNTRRNNQSGGPVSGLPTKNANVKMKNPLSLRPRFVLIAAAVLAIQVSTHAQDPTLASKKPVWESSAAAGLTLTSGNSDSVLGTLAATTGKKWNANEVALGIDGAYGKTKVNGVETKSAASIHGFGQYNRLFNERLYGYARVEGLHDDISKIRYRLTVSPGAGYYFIKNKTTDLCGEVGPGFVAQRLGSVTKDYFTLRLGEKFNHKLNDRARIWQTAELLPQIDRFKNYIFNFEIGIEADITKDRKLSLRTYLQDTYNSEPALGRKKNDMKLVTGIAYKF